MYLIIQSYPEKNKERAAEYLYVMMENLKHPDLTIIDLTENKCDTKININEKYSRECFGKRLTFLDAFKWARENLPLGSTVAVALLDIIFYHDSRYADVPFNIDGKDVVYCLSRHEYDIDKKVLFVPTDSLSIFCSNYADAYLFKNGCFPDDLESCNINFPIGAVPGSDNAIAHRFFKMGLVPINRGDKYIIVHWDKVRKPENPNHMITDDFHGLYKPGLDGAILVPRWDLVDARNLDEYQNIMRFINNRLIRLQGHYLKHELI